MGAEGDLQFLLGEPLLVGAVPLLPAMRACFQG